VRELVGTAPGRIVALPEESDRQRSGDFPSDPAGRPVQVPGIEHWSVIADGGSSDAEAADSSPTDAGAADESPTDAEVTGAALAGSAVAAEQAPGDAPAEEPSTRADHDPSEEPPTATTAGEPVTVAGPGTNGTNGRQPHRRPVKLRRR